MNTLIQIALSIAGIVIAFIPTGLYLLARYLLAPEGFWQNLLLLGVGAWLLGGLQIMLLIGLVYWLYLVWTDL